MNADILCRLDDIPDGQAKGFVRGEGLGRIRILVARQGDTIFGYHNECPHIGIQLDWMPDRFMSLDGQFLQCSTHGALFRIVDGYCVKGPCAGAELQPLPVRLENGMVLLESLA